MVTAPSEREIWRNAGVAAGLTVVIPVMVVTTTNSLRRVIGPLDPAVLLWWPQEISGGIILVMAVAVVIALGTGITVLGRDTIPWSRLARWPWAGVALLALAAVAISARADVRIYADRIVTTEADGARSAIPMATATGVEVRCAVISRRKKSDIPTLEYAIRFPGRTISLQPAMGSVSHGTARDWFRKVEALDRQVLAAVPHVSSGAAHDVNCIRALRAELGDTDFAAARRMLGIADAEVARAYAEPHEAWKSDAAVAR